jgi:hypothetical protein
MYLHKQFINRLIELTEQGLNWEKDESNSNAWASPNHYKTSLKKFDIHVIFSPNFGNNWTKKHIGNQVTNITNSSKRTNIIALIIIDTKNKVQQSLIFNEADPFDQIGFELFKIIVHYNNPQLEKAYVGDKMKESKILLSNLFEKIKKSS